MTDTGERVAPPRTWWKSVSAHRPTAKQARAAVVQAGAAMGLCPSTKSDRPVLGRNATTSSTTASGCGVGGDVFDFVMSIENIDFPAALEQLADRYGVEVKRHRTRGRLNGGRNCPPDRTSWERAALLLELLPDREAAKARECGRPGSEGDPSAISGSAVPPAAGTPPWWSAAKAFQAQRTGTGGTRPEGSKRLL